MKHFQVKKYFDWGSLKLEPQQYLTVSQADVENSLNVSRDSTHESIVVSKKAFQNQLALGTIEEK